MKNNLFFEFSVNKETNTISVKREFAVGVTLVWEAWTKPELLDQWWGSKDWVSTTKSMEFKEGGMRHYVMRGPEGKEHWGITSFEGIELHKSYFGLDCFADENANINPEYPQSKYKIKFIDKGTKTLIEHDTTYPDLAQLESSIEYGFEEGMIKAFEGLDKILVA